jgi:hypothetical protein
VAYSFNSHPSVTPPRGAANLGECRNASTGCTVSNNPPLLGKIAMRFVLSCFGVWKIESANCALGLSIIRKIKNEIHHLCAIDCGKG